MIVHWNVLDADCKVTGTLIVEGGGIPETLNTVNNRLMYNNVNVKKVVSVHQPCISGTGIIGCHRTISKVVIHRLR